MQRQKFQEMFGKFLEIAIDVLELESLPEFHFEAFLDHPEQPTFGMYVNNEKKLYVGLSGRHPNDIFRTIAHELTHYKQDTQHKLDSTSGMTGSPIENEAHAVAGIIMRLFNKEYPDYLRSKPVMEKWSAKYKKSINCANPKGFSQRAHCQGRKKTEDVEQDPGDPIPFPAGTTSVDVSDPYDWYKLGMVISDLDDANPQAFGRGGPSTVIAFGSEDEEHRLLPHLKRLGLKLQDIDKPSDTRKIVPAKAVLDKLEEDFRLDIIKNNLQELGTTQYKVTEPRDMVNVDFRTKQITYKVFKFKVDKQVFLIVLTVKDQAMPGAKKKVPTLNVAFGRQDKNGWDVDDIDTDLTGDNQNQFQIYSTVIKAIQKFITELNPNVAQIIIKGDNERQQVMYDRFFNSRYLEKFFPGWQLNPTSKSLVRSQVSENFADGRNPQDKGDSGRHGIKKGITIAQLKKIRSSDSASPRKKQLAHWQINMRQGRSKKG